MAFRREVERAVERRASLSEGEMSVEEPSTWCNYIGGSLNTHNRCVCDGAEREDAVFHVHVIMAQRNGGMSNCLHVV